MFNIHHSNVNSSLVCMPNYPKLVHTTHSTLQIVTPFLFYILQQSLKNFNHLVTNNHCQLGLPKDQMPLDVNL